MIVKNVNVENPTLHWEFIECENKVVLDLGCGRWEHVEYRDQTWLTTPEYLITKGAKIVYAIDIDQNEINWFNINLANKFPIVPLCQGISSVEDVRKLLNEYKPTVIKCDIEQNERAFLGLTDEEFKQIEFYALETHGDAIHNDFMNKFNSLGYDIIAVINLTHANPMKAIFAKRK